MEQNYFCESDSRSSGQEIPLILFNPKVHHHVHKNLSLGPILGQTNQVCIYIHILFSKVHFNIFLPSTLRSPKWAFHTNYIQWIEQIIRLLILKFLHSRVTSCLLRLYIILSILFLIVLNPCPSLRMRDHVHYETHYGISVQIIDGKIKDS
jgi:hypothetical protein